MALVCYVYCSWNSRKALMVGETLWKMYDWMNDGNGSYMCSEVKKSGDEGVRFGIRRNLDITRRNDRKGMRCLIITEILVYIRGVVAGRKTLC